MTHVVERCPSCGVEHDQAGAGGCEACGTPLRRWCRRHGRETGWLDTPACPRCADEAARPAAPAPRPRVTPAPAPRRPAPPLPERPAAPSPWPGGRSPREILRGPPPPAPDAEPELVRQPRRPGMVFITTTAGSIAGGVLAGHVLAVMIGADPADMAYFFGWILGGAGMVVGLIRSLAVAMDDDWDR